MQSAVLLWCYMKPCAYNTQGSRQWLLNTVHIFEAWFSSYAGTPHTPKGEGVRVSLVPSSWHVAVYFVMFPSPWKTSLAAECVLITLSDPSLQDFAHCPSCSRNHFKYEQSWGLGTCHHSHLLGENSLAIKLKHPIWKCNRDCSQSILCQHTQASWILDVVGACQTNFCYWGTGDWPRTNMFPDPGVFWEASHFWFTGGDSENLKALENI